MEHRYYFKLLPTAVHEAQGDMVLLQMFSEIIFNFGTFCANKARSIYGGRII